MISINAVEAVWLTASALGFIFTVHALVDAWQQHAIVRRLNDRAAEIAAATNVRREVIRLPIQALLLFVVVPRLFSDQETPLTPTLAALLAVPILLLVNTLFDLRDRRRLVDATLGSVQVQIQQASQRLENGMARLEHDLAENTARTIESGDKADAAYVAANDANTKLVAVTDAAAIVSGELRETVHDTGTKVDDIHQRIVDDKPDTP